MNYTQSEGSGNCLTCHGDFRANPYLRLGVDRGWGTSLMSGHMDVISDCDVCHTGPGQFYPTSTFSSGNATFDQSCLGCHGRFEDALGSDESSGLRQRHWEAGITLCGGCHPLDSDPAGFVPVGEDVLPPNYDVNLSVVGLTDPCNPGGAGEDFAGDSGGLDNDGDGAIDGLDPDCATPTPTPTPTPCGDANAHARGEGHAVSQGEEDHLGRCERGVRTSEARRHARRLPLIASPRRRGHGRRR